MRPGLPVLSFFLVTAAIGCGDNFEAPSVVDSVRIFATRADKPFAKPGDTVNLEVLAYDGRADRTRAMNLYWIPIPCVDPHKDLYYACFPALNGPGGAFQPGVDLTAQLVQGTTYSLTLPSDAITRHEPSPGVNDPYGLVIVFNAACAGHLEALPFDASSQDPQELPFGCFDDAHDALGPTDFVFGLTRVYAYTDRANANPELDAVLFQGSPVDPAAGIHAALCTNSDSSKCPALALDVAVPDSSDELDPADIDTDGNPRHEQIWVDYYLTGGKVDDDTRLLFDPAAGRVTPSATNYRASGPAGQGLLWAVVHDNRGGVTWAEVPLDTQ
jgi:hypothetical protein